MDTMNFIESWHKKLKYTHLGARQNHRIDSLIWTLRTALKDAEFEYEAVRMLIGRMKPRQREQQQHELAGSNLDVVSHKAIALNPHILNVLVQTSSFVG